jgi:hypothetical protein
MNGQSNGGPTIPRELIEWPSYTEQAQLIDPVGDELDDKLRGTLFVVSRLPQLFEQGQGPNGAPICVVDYLGNPRLRIWFTYDSQYVTLLGIARRG